MCVQKLRTNNRVMVLGSARIYECMRSFHYHRHEVTNKGGSLSLYYLHRYTQNYEQRKDKEMKNMAQKPNYNFTDFWRPVQVYIIGQTLCYFHSIL